MEVNARIVVWTVELKHTRVGIVMAHALQRFSVCGQYGMKISV